MGNNLAEPLKKGSASSWQRWAMLSYLSEDWEVSQHKPAARLSDLQAGGRGGIESGV